MKDLINFEGMHAVQAGGLIWHHIEKVEELTDYLMDMANKTDDSYMKDCLMSVEYWKEDIETTMNLLMEHIING